MAKIYSYDNSRTYAIEYIPSDSNSLVIGDLTTISSGKVIALADDTKPTYIVVGEKADGKYPVAAITDDMILENASAIYGFSVLGNNKYRK